MNEKRTNRIFLGITVLLAVAAVVLAFMQIRGREKSPEPAATQYYQVTMVIEGSLDVVPGDAVKIAGHKVGEVISAYATGSTGMNIILKIQKGVMISTKIPPKIGYGNKHERCVEFPLAEKNDGYLPVDGSAVLSLRVADVSDTDEQLTKIEKTLETIEKMQNKVDKAAKEINQINRTLEETTVKTENGQDKSRE